MYIHVFSEFFETFCGRYVEPGRLARKGVQVQRTAATVHGNADVTIGRGAFLHLENGTGGD
jgi:hypothetical protein